MKAKEPINTVTKSKRAPKAQPQPEPQAETREVEVPEYLQIETKRIYLLEAKYELSDMEAKFLNPENGLLQIKEHLVKQMVEELLSNESLVKFTTAKEDATVYHLQLVVVNPIRQNPNEKESNRK